MIKFNDKTLLQYESDLKTFAARSYPFATKQTVNKSAFTGQAIAKSMIKGKMTLRNRFTLSSIRVVPTRSLRVSQQEARMGSDADYMEQQEFGAVLRSKGRYGRPIATPAASGETGLPRRRLPRKANKMRNIRLAKSRLAAKTRKQRNRIAIKEARENGAASKFVFLDMGRRSGIYRVTKTRVTKLWDLSKRTVVIPARPTITPAALKAHEQTPRFYRDALQFQLRRLPSYRGL